MSKFKPKAEQMFEAKMKRAIEDRDWDEVTKLFHLYGCYLELIEPMPERPAQTKELVFVGHNEPTVGEEHLYVLSGQAAAVEAEWSEHYANQVTASRIPSDEKLRDIIDQL